MAKANAFVNGRDYVVPDDVRYVFTDVCAHRLVITQRARLAGKDSALLAKEILNCVPVPTIDTRK